MADDNSPTVAQEVADGQTDINDSSASEPPPKKRVCLEDSNAATDQPLVPPAPIPLLAQHLSHLQRLPLELLAEILEYTRSPKDVLSVTRTCKSLCATLISPSSNFIWKTVRRDSVVPVPDPIEIFSEVSYASFLFDSGKCEMCNKETGLPYTSFGLRLRLCKEQTCLAKFMSERMIHLTNSEVDQTVMQWTPLLEAVKGIFPQLPNHVWPALPGYCSRDVWNKAIEEYRSGRQSPDYIAGKQAAKKRNETWMKFCVELYKWKTTRSVREMEIKNRNQQLLIAFSEKSGWVYKDVLNLKLYGTWHNHKCKILELITLDDLRTREKDTEQELLALEDKRKHAARARGQQKNWNDINTCWEKLRSDSTISGLPSLSTFRTLPLVSLILESEAHLSFPYEKAMKSMLEEQIKRWTEDATTEFDKMLGFQNWRTANSKLVHPCRRFSSRFQCKLCRALTDKYLTDGCLDFDGVCAHECRPKDKTNKNWKPPVWKPDNFEIDQRASLAAKMLLQLLNISDEKHVSTDKLTGWIVCQSCKPTTILHPRSVVGHSHRHLAGEFSIQIPSQEECTRHLGGHQHVDFGTALKLAQSSYRSRKIREEKKFGCWICSRSQGGWISMTAKGGNQNGETSTKASDDRDADEVNKNASRKKPPLFIWIGIRSHLKEKHRIEQVRDEDFYIIDLQP